MTTQMTVDVLSDTANCPIIRFAGRKFPGVLIQGDTLKILAGTVAGLRSTDLTPEDYDIELQSIIDQLNRYLLHYERTLRANGLQLPYVRKE